MFFKTMMAVTQSSQTKIKVPYAKLKGFPELEN